MLIPFSRKSKSCRSGTPVLAKRKEKNVIPSYSCLTDNTEPGQILLWVSDLEVKLCKMDSPPNSLFFL